MERPGFFERLGESLAQGGLSGAAAVLWPHDLPEGDFHAPQRPLPPLVHSAFFQPQPAPSGFPEHYLLIPGLLDDSAEGLLVETSRWISAGLGENWAAVLPDCGAKEFDHLDAGWREAGIGGALMRVDAHTPRSRAALFQHARAVLHLSPVLPWGDALLQSLASGTPVAAEETTIRDGRLGPAGYLVEQGAARSLGAAVITLLVNNDVVERISAAARERAAGWNKDRFGLLLEGIYRGLTNKT